jgi:hypothetical protein
MHHHRQLVAAASIVAAVMGSLSVTLTTTHVDAAPKPEASVEVADTATLAPDGETVTIDIAASCARGWPVLEAFITISRPQISGTASHPLGCTARMQSLRRDGYIA